MSKGFRFELDLGGLNQLMKSPEMQDCLQKAGEKVAEESGIEAGVRVHNADFVAIANVYPETAKAARENARNNSLLKGLGAAGLPLHK